MGMIDNNQELHGKRVDGIMVYSPQSAQQLNTDYIVLMSDAAIAMREQLVQMGYSQGKIIHYLDFFALFPKEVKRYGVDYRDDAKDRKRLLIVSVPLFFSGVPIVAFTTAIAAKKLGYFVDIAASWGDEKYIEEAARYGINILLCEELGSLYLEDIAWMKRYDVILVNAIPMIRLAIKIAEIHKVMVWIHESLDEYERIKFWKEEIDVGIQNKRIVFYAPSKRARNHFFQWFGEKKEVFILPLGVMDKRVENPFRGETFVYGLIGGFMKGKGQDIFLSAIERNPSVINDKVSFVLVGRNFVSDYGNAITERSNAISNCFILGEKTNQEIEKIYQMLDVLVVASRAETVSMVAIEAMMMGKICIVSDQTGIAEYIEHGKNGFIFQSENDKELSAIMLWCYQNRGKLDVIRKAARETYEQNFSMDRFQANLQDIFQSGNVS
ncbi:MAG: glycosyltransferase family 4 protein [Hespellia sp.]|nr:glycosyltransferase family 4 protein [Hespellia sp.]